MKLTVKDESNKPSSLTYPYLGYHINGFGIKYIVLFTGRNKGFRLPHDGTTTVAKHECNWSEDLYVPVKEMEITV